MHVLADETTNFCVLSHIMAYCVCARAPVALNLTWLCNLLSYLTGERLVSSPRAVHH